MTTVAAALAGARQIIPLSEARLLLGHVLGQATAWLLAHDEALLDDTQRQQFMMLVTRRAAGEPVAYLLGTREFYGREFRVTPAVLIPRPETELLVEVALSAIDRIAVRENRPVRVLDLGTGSGCVAISVVLARPDVVMTAVDISPDALAVAQENAVRSGALVSFHQGSWFDGLSSQSIDLVVSNPPYIAVSDPHLTQGDLRFEPTQALASGSDGLYALRQIIERAPQYLSNSGELWLEHGYDQAMAMRDLLSQQFVDVEQYRDLAGIVRVSGGRKSA